MPCKILNSNIKYPTFGSVTPGRSFTSMSYRYGFNGKEKDNEAKGSGNSYDFGERIYDPRLGRWQSMDPVIQPWQSPYCGLNNSPIYLLDPNGEKVKAEIDKTPDDKKDKNSTTLTETQQYQSLLNTKAELENETGLKLSLVKTSEKNKDVYEFVIDKSSSPQGGSKKARKLMKEMINSDDQVTVLFNSRFATSTDIGKDVINLNPMQIAENALDAHGISTLGASYGISVLHEFLHVKYGGHSARVDKFGNIDKIVRKENQIRKQLGPSFGIRSSYMGISVKANQIGSQAELDGNTDQYLPMSRKAMQYLKSHQSEPSGLPYFIRHGADPNYQREIGQYGGIK